MFLIVVYVILARFYVFPGMWRVNYLSLSVVEGTEKKQRAEQVSFCADRGRRYGQRQQVDRPGGSLDEGTGVQPEADHDQYTLCL